MTCIVGLINDGQVLIAGDSVGVAGGDTIVRADPKVFERDGWVFGFTGSYRMGQLIRYKLTLPFRRPDQDLFRFMVIDFVESLRTCLKDGGYARRKDEEEQAGEFLVGHAGRLFTICSDYQVAEASQEFAACGSGAQVARGSLFSTSSRSPASRLTTALEAAEAFCGCVRGPFTVVTT